MNLSARVEPCESERDRILLSCDGQTVYAVDRGSWESRSETTLAVLADALSRIASAPVFDAVLETGDQPRLGSWGFCERDGCDTVAVPDFAFGGWPEVGIPCYRETMRSLLSASTVPQDRALFWRGALTNRERARVVKALAGRTDCDIAENQWTQRGKGAQMDGTAYEPITECGKHYALLDMGGCGWSARLRFLLASGRPVIMLDRPWREWWHRYLRNGENVLMAQNESEIIAHMRRLLDNPREANEIGAAGRALVAERCSYCAALARWRAVIIGEAK